MIIILPLLNYLATVKLKEKRVTVIIMLTLENVTLYTIKNTYYKQLTNKQNKKGKKKIIKHQENLLMRKLNEGEEKNEKRLQ